jgi:putative colanic acid biosynthesis acetyltransferase WcaF
MKADSCLGSHVDCYCVDRIEIGERATVSQYTYLCSAGHDIADRKMGLLTGPITIGRDAWVAADAYIGPGVSVGEGAVVGARGSVFKDVSPWDVVVGNPAKPIKRRVLRD